MHYGPHNAEDLGHFHKQEVEFFVFFCFMSSFHDRAPPQRLYPDFSDRVAPSVDIKGSLSPTH